MQTTCHDCCQPWASSSGKTYSSLAITSWWNRSWKNDTEEEYLTNVQRSLSTVRLITFCSQVAFQFFMLSLLGELTGNGLNCIVNGPNNKVSKWLGWKRFSSSMPAWLIGCYLPPRCRWVKLPELSSVCIPMQLVRSLHTGNWRLVEPHETCWTTCWQWCMFIFLLPDNMQALDLIVTAKGPFAVANTSQSLPRMPVIYEGAPLMTLTFCPQLFAVCYLACYTFSSAMLQTNQGRAARICSHASNAFCWDTWLPQQVNGSQNV